MADRNQEPDIDEEKKSLFLFGRNVAEIPCFRSSFLYGSGAGFIVALGAFMGTSRPRMATHVGFATFFCTTIGYWFTCRYNYSKQKFFYSQLQPAMRKQAIFEGTGVEAEVTRKGESV